MSFTYLSSLYQLHLEASIHECGLRSLWIIVHSSGDILCKFQWKIWKSVFLPGFHFSLLTFWVWARLVFCLTNKLRSTERYFCSLYVFSILLKGKTLPNDFVEMLSFVDPFKYNLYLAKPKTSNRITNAKQNFNFMLIWYIRLSFCL